MNLPFDIHRFTHPKTASDFEALLDEALLELQNLNDHLEATATYLELMSRLTGAQK